VTLDLAAHLGGRLVIGAASPLLAISLRRPKSSEMLSQDRRQAALELAK